MFDSKKKIKLTDLIDIEFLQEFQDFFAKTMGVASIAVDDAGPITKPSNYTDFCIKYMKSSEEADRRCNKCDIMRGKIAAKSGNPEIYTCHSGLINFVVPIMIGEEHVASIVGGQVLTAPPDEERFRTLAKELGVNEDEYIDAVKQIKIVPKATIDAAANFLYLVANAISKIAYKNFELIKKNEKGIIYRNIIDTIRSSLDINEIKQIIVNTIGKTLETDRCFLSEYDKIINKFLIVEDEYLSSNDILSYKGSDPNKTAPSFAEAFKNGKSLLIKNKEIYLDIENQDFDAERAAIEQYSINSAFSFPLFYFDEFLGVLSIHYVTQEHEISEEEINLIKMIGNQIAIAFHQAKLYKLTQLDAQREYLLRTIIETIRSSLDIEETLYFICKKAAELFNVQRTAITVFPNPEKYEEFIIRKEYKSSQDIEGFEQTKDSSKLAAYWGNILLENQKAIAIDNIRESDTPDYFKDSYDSTGVKSIIGIALRKSENVWGTLILSEYNNYRHWTDEEKILLKTISDQIYIAINQAELYEHEQKQAKKEKFSRNIIEILRNTIDKNIIKHLFVRSIANYFNADRVFFSDFDLKNNIYLPVEEGSEFLSSTEEKSFFGQNWTTDAMKEYIQPLLGKRELKIPCWDEYVEKNKPSNNFRLRFEDAKVKSSYNFPVVHEGTIMGYFCIEFTHEECKKLSDDDIYNIRIICSQAGIALYHAELYRKEKETAEREHILRKVIGKIRSSLNIEDIKHEIVNQIGTLFSADRVGLGYYDPKLQSYIFSENAEYRSSDQIKSFIGVDFNIIPDFIKFIRDTHLSGKDIIFSDLEKYLADNHLKGTRIENFYREFGFTSSMALNVVYNDIFFGNLVITFEQNKVFSDDEITFLRAIADQAGTAFYQARLFNEKKQIAENESALRQIMLSLVSTFNLEEIIHSIVTETGKLFKADRCFYIEYDYTTDSHFPIKEYAQYLSSQDIRSHLTRQPNKVAVSAFIDLIKQKKLITVDNIYKTDLPESSKQMLIDDLSVKSYLISPVYYGESIYGAIVLHYVKDYKSFTSDDTEIAKAVANQSAIVISQAKLYDSVKQNAEKEAILREIINNVKLTQNVYQGYSYIITKLADIFGVSKIFFVENPTLEYEKSKIKYEYIRNQGLLSFQDSELPDFISDLFANLAKKTNPLIADDITELYSDNESALQFYRNNSIKSFMAIQIINPSQDEVPGIIIICSSKLRTWTQREIELLKNIIVQFTSIIREIIKIHEIDELLNTFIITLSKGVQVPLGTQKEALEFLASQDITQPMGEFKGIIDETLDNSKILFDLLTKLLDSYHYESGKKKLDFGQYNMAEIINNVKDELIEAANSKDININININKDIPEIKMDKEEIRKVVYTLLESAINHTQNNGTIEIKSYKIGKDLITCVSDNGYGMSAEIKEKIFQRSAVMTQIIDKKIRGNLGFYLSKLIAEAHEGKIWCESEVGIGTIFCFLLPTRQE